LKEKRMLAESALEATRTQGPSHRAAKT
jgi:hypothetical protein